MVKLSSKKYSYLVVSLILLLLILIRNYGMKTMPNKYQKVVVHLGEDIRNTQENSTCDLKVNREIDDIDGFIVQATPDMPVIVQYRASKHSFTLPPTLLIMIGTKHDKVYDIDVTPQLELLNLNNATKLLEKIIKIMDNAGWPQYKTSPLIPLAELPQYFDNPKNDEADIQVRNLNGNRVFLSIKRQLTVKDQEEDAPKLLLGKPEKFEDKFLVEVYMTNAQI